MDSEDEKLAEIRADRVALLHSIKLRGQEQMRSLRFNVDTKDRKKVLTALKMAQILEGTENYGESIVLIADFYIKAKKASIMSGNETVENFEQSK